MTATSKIPAPQIVHPVTSLKKALHQEWAKPKEKNVTKATKNGARSYTFIAELHKSINEHKANAKETIEINRLADLNLNGCLPYKSHNYNSAKHETTKAELTQKEKYERVKEIKQRLHAGSKTTFRERWIVRIYDAKMAKKAKK